MDDALGGMARGRHGRVGERDEKIQDKFLGWRQGAVIVRELVNDSVRGGGTEEVESRRGMKRRLYIGRRVFVCSARKTI